MAELIFFKRPDILDEEHALYFKDLLFRTAKVGTELEFAMPKEVKREEFQPKVEALLKPSRSLAMLGESGVLDVAKEHCGAEVRIIGRYPYYDVLIDQYEHIISALLPLGIRARPTCGLHFHLLTTWFAHSIPEIVLANLWNLVRRYASFLKFIFSGGSSFEGLCRRRQHNSHLEFVRHTPLALSMREIQQILKKSKTVPEHQNFMNLEHVRFEDDGSVSMFHIEFRFPDADLAPTSIVAKTFLFMALLLRSVECVKYGLIHVGKIQEWRRNLELLDKLSNNDGNLATSDTSHLSTDDLEELSTGCEEMLKFLKPAFARFENPALRVLRFLARRPISFMRSDGLGWEEIERLLSKQAAAERRNHLDSTDERLVRIIELGDIKGQPDDDRWLNRVADTLWIPRADLDLRMKRLARRKPRWDAEMGSYIFLR